MLKRVEVILEVQGEYTDYSCLNITLTQFEFLKKVIKTLNEDLMNTSINIKEVKYI